MHSTYRYLFLLLLVVLVAAAMRPQPAPPPPADEDGAEIYATRCQSCHQANGKGISGVFPPLDEVDWVTGDKGRLIRILLYGVTGEIDVNGVVYSGAMPPWSTFLNDEQLAALMTYIRSAWNNEAAAVTADEVGRVREATKYRKDPWTQAELEDAANTGIPGSNPFGFLGPPPKADTTRRHP